MKQAAQRFQNESNLKIYNMERKKHIVKNDVQIEKQATQFEKQTTHTSIRSCNNNNEKSQKISN